METRIFREILLVVEILLNKDQELILFKEGAIAYPESLPLQQVN